MRFTLSFLSVFVLCLSAFAGEKNLGVWAERSFENQLYGIRIMLPEGMARATEDEMKTLAESAKRDTTVYVAMKGISKETDGVVAVLRGTRMGSMRGFSVDAGKRYLENLKVPGLERIGEIREMNTSDRISRGDFRLGGRSMFVYAFFRNDSMFTMQIEGPATSAIASVAELVGLGISFKPAWQRSISTSEKMRIKISSPAAERGIKKKVNPSYPLEARMSGVSGAVVLRAVIGTDGVVNELFVMEGHALLVPNTINAVKEWRYLPYVHNGKAYTVETQIVVNFNLSR